MATDWGVAVAPHRLVQAAVPPDTAAVLGALTVASVLTDLIAPVNLILGIAFFAGALLDFMTGTLKSFVNARAAGEKNWFNEQKFIIGCARKFALILFVPIAGLVDVIIQIAPYTAELGQLSPTTKAVLVALSFGQASSAARNIYAIAGDQAAGPLGVILKRIGENAEGGNP